MTPYRAPHPAPPIRMLTAKQKASIVWGVVSPFVRQAAWKIGSTLAWVSAGVVVCYLSGLIILHFWPDGQSCPGCSHIRALIEASVMGGMLLVAAAGIAAGIYCVLHALFADPLTTMYADAKRAIQTEQDKLNQ